MSTDSVELTSEQISPRGPAGRMGFLSSVERDLATIERLLNDEIRSDVRAAYAISGHTLSAGGKRLRPALVTLCARAACSAFPERKIYASAAAAELIHMASLIHDDVVDNSLSRRGRPTANAEFGNQISVLVGDYLLAKSIYLAAREGDLDVIRVFSRVTVGLSEGEVLQITARGDVDTSEATYHAIIEKKTAGFISGCCEIGAMLAGAPESAREALALYGLDLGRAFQIADDLLDYTGDPAVTGKPLCSDLREGKMTLPLILTLQNLSPPDRDDILEILQDPETLTDSAIAHVVAAIDGRGGFERTAEAARAFVRSAQESLCALPQSPYRTALMELAAFAAGREV